MDMVKEELGELLRVEVNSVLGFGNCVYVDVKNVGIYCVELFVRMERVCDERVNDEVMEWESVGMILNHSDIGVYVWSKVGIFYRK